VTIFDVLLRLTEHPPESWRPDDNPNHPKAVTGTIVKLGVYENDMWGQSPSLTIMGADGKGWRWLALHTVPKDELGWERFGEKGKQGRYTDRSPRVGDPIAVAYKGRVESGDSAYEDWRVAFVHAEHAHLFGSGAVAPAPEQGVELAVGSAPDRPTPPEDDDWHGPMCGTCGKPVRGKARLVHGVKYHDDCDDQEPF
jgi:hypothetical protein